MKHEHYGRDGPLSTCIKALVLDTKGTLWIGTPLSLSVRTADGKWRYLRRREGLPEEDVTALAVDKEDNLWIGTSRGAIFWKPVSRSSKAPQSLCL